MTGPPQFLETASGRRLAYVQTPGTGPGVLFLGGFKSDMTGTKAMALEAHCRAQGRACLRFDYSGHGQSAGAFEDGTIGQWRDDALAVLDSLTQGPQLLAGSSMGGWIALLAALARPGRVAGLVLVAPAPDFTRWGIAEQLDDASRAALMRDGKLTRPSDYGEDYVYTRALIEDGARHCLMGGPTIALNLPVRILHGQRDDVVPWQLSLDLAAGLASDDVVLSLIKNGDHRLSSDDDLQRLTAAVDELAAHAS